MAKLSDEIIIRILNLQRLLLQGIDEAKASEFEILARYGETIDSQDVLLQLDSATERLRVSYVRLFNLLLRIAEAQPLATNAMLELLAQSIEQGQANTDAVAATIKEIKRDWKL
jgi:hypothetical protein